MDCQYYKDTRKALDNVNGELRALEEVIKPEIYELINSLTSEVDMLLDKYEELNNENEEAKSKIEELEG